MYRLEYWLRLATAVLVVGASAVACATATPPAAPGPQDPAPAGSPTATGDDPGEPSGEGDAIVLISGMVGAGTTITMVSLTSSAPITTYRYPDVAVNQWHSFSPGYDRRAAVGGDPCTGAGCIGMTAAGYIDGTTGAFHAVTPEATGFGPRPIYRDPVFVGEDLAVVKDGTAFVLAESGAPVPGYPTDFLPGPGQRLVSSPLGFVAAVDTEPQGWSVPNCLPDPVTRGQVCVGPADGLAHRLTVVADGANRGSFGDDLPADVDLMWVNQDGSVLFTERLTGHRRLFVMPRADAGQRRPITPETDYVILGAAVSPDGGRIAFTAARGDAGAELFLISADGGEPVRLLDGLPPGARVIDWT